MRLLDYFLRKFRLVRQLEREKARLAAEVAAQGRTLAEWSRFSPPGHFYSPLPSREEVAEAFARGGFGPPFPAVVWSPAPPRACSTGAGRSFTS